MSFYPYKPLEDGAIRLIQFDELEDDSILRLRLSHTSLYTVTHYFALSYTWGKPFGEMSAEWSSTEPTKVITIDGVEFPVRISLEAALQKFQSDFVNSGTLLWVDAISINQDDILERNRQVAMMGEIYSKSLCTLVWLGPDVNDSDLSLRAIRELQTIWKQRPARLQEHPIPQHSDPEEIIELYRHHVNLESAAVERQESDDFSRPDGLIHLLGRNWWGRAWVVQEVLLSQRTLVFCGSSEPIQRNDFVAAAQVLLNIRESYLVLGHEFRPTMVEWLMDIRVGSLFNADLSLPYTCSDTKHSLRDMLRLMRMKQASDPRDKVYAGLGLLKNEHDIEVDYRIPVSKLYTDVTKLCIEREQNLHILSCCNSEPGHDLPSWVPNFSNSNRRLSQANIFEDSGVAYTAGGSYPFEPEFEGSTLVLSGVFFGIVSYIGKIESEKRFPRKQRVVEAAMEASWLSKWLFSFAFRKLPPLLGYLHESNEYMYKITNDEIWQVYLRTLTGGCQPPEDELANPEYRRKASTVLQHRSFIACDNGAIGLSSRHSLEGDMICFIAGADTPLLLRSRSDGKFIFVGECYVHGLMYGGVWDLLAKQNDEHKADLVRIEVA